MRELKKKKYEIVDHRVVIDSHKNMSLNYLVKD